MKIGGFNPQFVANFMGKMRFAAVIVSFSTFFFSGKTMKPLLQEHRSGAYAAQIVMKPEFYEKTLEKLDFIVSLIGEASWTEFSKGRGKGSATNFFGNDTLGRPHGCLAHR